MSKISRRDFLKLTLLGSAGLIAAHITRGKSLGFGQGKEGMMDNLHSSDNRPQIPINLDHLSLKSSHYLSPKDLNDNAVVVCGEVPLSDLSRYYDTNGRVPIDSYSSLDVSKDLEYWVRVYKSGGVGGTDEDRNNHRITIDLMFASNKELVVTDMIVHPAFSSDDLRKIFVKYNTVNISDFF